MSSQLISLRCFVLLACLHALPHGRAARCAKDGSVIIMGRNGGGARVMHGGGLRGENLLGHVGGDGEQLLDVGARGSGSFSADVSFRPMSLRVSKLFRDPHNQGQVQ